MKSMGEDVIDIRLPSGGGLISPSFFRAMRSVPPACEARLRVPLLQGLRYRFLAELGARFVRARRRVLVDEKGQREDLSWATLALAGASAVVEFLALPFVLIFLYGIFLYLHFAPRKSFKNSGESKKKFAYLFLPFNFESTKIWGGAAAHMRGLLAGMTAHGWQPLVLSSQSAENFPTGPILERVFPWRWGGHIPNLPILLYNFRVMLTGIGKIKSRNPVFIYQRHLLFNVSGVLLSRALRRPLVLEYNCSEVWMVRHWGRGWTFLMHLARWAENLSLRSADLIVVVSERVREELLQRGVSPEKILISFNGVDTRVFHPGVDGSSIRRFYEIPPEKIVAGFTGSFSQWHGVDVLAEAIKPALDAEPRLHFLLVGDGPLMSAVRRRAKEQDCVSRVTFTGRIPAQAVPIHLAACNILLSPHVNNPDGSAFFGSPTKLFEYLAMGKAIVASDIEQLGKILEHGRTALLVPPADAGALANAIIQMTRDAELRSRLGGAACREAAKHRWESRAEGILKAARERFFQIPAASENGGSGV
jgi:glycosyltransferase involved in cell wall biosynthesis